MPQVDLETLVSACAGGDRKIACETLADGEKPPEEEPDQQAEVPPDFPPESFWLSKDAEFDWFDRNAFLERKESTKGNSNLTNLNPGVNPTLNTSSQRFSANLKSKAAIIGLPKTQKTTFVDPANRRNCKPANIRLFPKRSESVGKSAVAEPSSPKVSCMGRVRSKRGRRRSKEKENTVAKPAQKAGNGGRQKKGICRLIFGIFLADRKENPVAQRNQQLPAEEETPRRSAALRVREFSTTDEPAATTEPPSLGGMKRFASGRRSTGAESDSDASRGDLRN